MQRLILVSVAVVAILAVAVGINSPVSAVEPDGSVSLEPAAALVPAGGTASVSVHFDPPASGVSVFIIEVAYDPSLVQFVDCEEWIPPPAGVGAAGCASKDSDGDSVHDTAVAFGAYVENRGGEPFGFETPQNVGTFTFESLGKKGDVSPLILNAEPGNILGPQGNALSPEMVDGSICTTGKHAKPVNALRKCAKS